MYALIENDVVVDLGFTVPLIMANMYSQFTTKEVDPESISFKRYTTPTGDVTCLLIKACDGTDLIMLVEKPVDMHLIAAKTMITILSLS